MLDLDFDLRTRQEKDNRAAGHDRNKPQAVIEHY